MSIPVQYQSFKAAGIYRVVYDKSTVMGIDAEILRLVVGYSEQGPFNTPIYIKSKSEFITVFGGISKKLEKRGVFFHRLALQALESGPILALSLKKFSGEVVEGIAFNPQDASTTKDKLFVEDIYDTSRFWSLDPLRLNESNIAEKDNKTDKYIPSVLPFGDSKYIRICATSIKGQSHSLFIRPASGNIVAQYKMTVSDWYKSTKEEMPEYFEGYENTLISNYFAEVYVFKGEFVPSQVLASNTLMKYFDGFMENDKLQIRLKSCVQNSFGDNVDTLDALFNEMSAQPVGHYVGSLIPYFKNAQGAYTSLDIVFNSDSDAHHMMMSFDEDLLENMDALLIELSGTNSINTKKLNEIFKGEGTSSALGNNNAKINSSRIEVDVDVNADDKVTYTGYDLNKEQLSDNNDNNEGTKLYGNDSVVFCELDYNSSHYEKEDGEETFEQLSNIPITFFNDDNEEIKCDVIGILWLGIHDAVAKIYDEDGVNVNDQQNKYKINKEAYKKYVDLVPAELRNAEISNVIITPNTSLVGLFNKGDMVLRNVNADSDTKTNTAIVQAVESFTIGDEEFSFVGISAPATKFNNKYIVRIDGTLNSEIGDLRPIYLEGYTFNNPKPTDIHGNLSTDMYDKLTWQKEIISALTEYTGLRTGLLTKSEIDYRYIVDTFESFVDSSCKDVFSFLAKEKQSCFAILNFPSVKTFLKCKYTSFKNAKGLFNVQYVVDGFNKKKPASKKFSLPSDADGASFCAFYTPLKFSDGTLDTIVPSAGLVSNLFMEKYLSRQPYYIIAGPNYGRIVATGLVGPDYNYTPEELNIIEPFGVNCMVYVPGFGTFINANQTAKQTPVSALSKVNVRELVIYIQDEVEKILRHYQWDFNTPQTRQAIKDKADQICERVKANGGIYEYLNVMDSSNNTNEIIDNEMSVISTHIEAGRGCGKMVQELTLYGTGQLASMITE